MPVSAEKVEITFSQKVAEAERVVRKRVLRQALNQEQFDALVSFTFNAGQRGAESVLAKAPPSAKLRTKAEVLGRMNYETA